MRITFEYNDDEMNTMKYCFYKLALILGSNWGMESLHYKNKRSISNVFESCSFYHDHFAQKEPEKTKEQELMNEIMKKELHIMQEQLTQMEINNKTWRETWNKNKKENKRKDTGFP